MEKQNLVFIDPNSGDEINVNLKVNKNLKKKNNILNRRIAATALALTIGVGTVLGGCALFNKKNSSSNNLSSKPTTSISVSTFTPLSDYNEVKEGLKFNPNSKDGIIEKSVFLIEEAARFGKHLDAKDAVLTVITANVDQLTAGFMGKLFGERADHTYTYGHLVDAYLRTAMMQVENIGVAKNDDIAFNIENIFANNEDHKYLSNIRELTTRFNNSTDEAEKAEITNTLNQIALSLCTYETYDISSSAGVLSMLSLDGMRIITNNSNNPVLHDDIRDEMFGNGDYSCLHEGTYTNETGLVVQTQYSFRVNDLKLDGVKAKLDNAVLEAGETTILNEIIKTVEEQTKDVVISDFNVIEEIQKQREENRDVAYEYESSPGVIKDNYSEKTDEDVVENVNGEEVIVVPSNPEAPTTNPEQEETTPSVEENKEKAEEELEDKLVDAQAETDKGAAAGKEDAMSGRAKRNLAGMSEYYVSAYHISYDAWKKVYDAQNSNEKDVPVDETKPTDSINEIESQAIATENEEITVETISLDQLTKEELQVVKELIVGSVNTIENNENVKIR